MNLDELRHIVGRWASQKPLVKRAHIFGSRARDDYRSDSDLDIAIELDVSEFKGCDDSGGIATWMFEADEWTEELQALTGFDVQLEQFVDEECTPTIARALFQSSVLAYEKALAPAAGGLG